MHTSRSTRPAWTVGILVAVAVIPVAVACVIPRTLAEQVQLSGDEIVLGAVQSVSEVWIDEPSGSAFPWTIVDFDVEESFASGKTGPIQMITRGSLQPGQPSTSITPSHEDLRAGRRLLVFLNKRSFEAQELGQGGQFIIPSFAEVYRIEDVETRTGLRQVLVGQGPGMAFPANVDLEQARAELRQAVRTNGGEHK
jgi:hypothetical protein